MPALIFTADSGTDQLASAAHGLVTGDGPAATRNIGGALPSPLAGVTDYYIIRVDADHVKLATSNANALAGTAINLTTNGTGTNVLELGIPYRRARTYVAKAVSVPGSQVKSADLNSLQDSDTALYDLLTGQAQPIYTNIRLPVNHHVAVSGTGRHKHGSVTLLLGPLGFQPLAGVAIAYGATLAQSINMARDIPILAGKTITEVRVKVRDVAGSTMTVSLNRIDGYAAGAVIGTSAPSSGAGADQTLTVTAGLPIPTVAGSNYTISAQRNSGAGTDLNVSEVEVDYHELLP